MTIKQIQQDLRERRMSCTEITQHYLATINQQNPDINAFLDIYQEDALRQAREVDNFISGGGELEPMTGIPIAIKDNILIDGKRATAGSKILEQHTATYDANVVKKLKKAQAVFLGKTNLDEFAMGASTENSAFGVTKNPHDSERVAGGSSGGSAAAVAANMAPTALGTDTGGSVRQPAHFCGVVGFKPTYGAVSRSGVIALASSLDQVGPLAHTVEDAKIVFQTISGTDQYDNTSQVNIKPETQDLNLANLKIGLPKEYFIDGIAPEVQAAIKSVVDFYRSSGAQIKEISLPHTKYALASYYLTMPAEASSNLARFDGIRYSPVNGVERQTHNLVDLYRHNKGVGLGEEPKRRILLGTYALSAGYYDAYYKKAIEAKEYITQDFNKVFGEVDFILTPTAPTPAFKIGEKANDPLQMYLSDIFTISANLSGNPAISIPVKHQSPLPIGFQLIAPHGYDLDLFNLGQTYDQLAN